MKLPGLVVQSLPSGNVRYRVRPKGDHSKYITIKIKPDENKKEFLAAYNAARNGEVYKASADDDKIKKFSIEWLVREYLLHMQTLVKSGLLSTKTLKERTRQLTNLCKIHGSKDARTMPRHAVIAWRDTFLPKTPTADNAVKALRACYMFGIERGYVLQNPTMGIKKITKSYAGAKPWTEAEIHQFLAHHPRGTIPHMWCILSLITAARVGDIRLLGPKHVKNGTLAWQPSKRGSTYVSVPIPDVLHAALLASDAYGRETFIVASNGKPYVHTSSLTKAVAKWVEAAGMSGLSSHGLRKSAGEIMALAGLSTYHIMSVHGHSSQQTSAVYTKGVDRAKMAQDGVAALAQRLVPLASTP